MEMACVCEVLLSIAIKAPVLSLPLSFHLKCYHLYASDFEVFTYGMKECYTAHFLTSWRNRYDIFYVFDGRYSPGMLVSILKSEGAS